MNEVTLPNDDAQCGDQTSEGSSSEGITWVAVQPFFPTRDETTASRLNWFVSKPPFKILGQGQRGRVAALRILLQALQTDRREIAIYFRIQQPRLLWIRFQNQPDRFVGASSNKRRITGQQLVQHRAETINVCRGC